MDYLNGLHHYTLLRDDDNGTRCLGTWIIDPPGHESIKVHTIERPWLDNEPFVSCIPGGTYLVKKYSSESFPDVWEITKVPGRSKILIHIANYWHDVRGCVGPGLSRGEDEVWHSGDAMDELRERLPDQFYLTIATKTEEYP